MAAILPLVIGPAMELLKRFIPDKKEQADAEIKLREILLDADRARYQSEAEKAKSEASKVESASSVIRSETESDSWMAKNWRPFLMFFFMGLIAWGAVINPLLRAILNAFGVDLVVYQTPPQIWDIIWVCVGGYVIGRSGEKMIGMYADAKEGAAQANADAEVAKFNAKAYFDELKRTAYPNGMTQEDVDRENDQLRSAGLIK